MADATKILTVSLLPTPPFPGGQASDLCGIDDFKLEMGIDNRADDAWLRAIISRLSASAQSYMNRLLGPQWVAESHWARRDPWPRIVSGGDRPLQLSRWPLLSAPGVTSIGAPFAPALSAVSGGALPAATYWTRVTYSTPTGETPASADTALPVAAGSLLSVASPAVDTTGTATGWNVYVGTAAFGETQQNAAPLAIGSTWTLPTTGLVAGATPPTSVLVVENAKTPRCLIEGIDFRVDTTTGQLTRLRNGLVIDWPAFPYVVVYLAGYEPIPADVQDAVLKLVKARWFARDRDPQARQVNVVGVMESSYWFGAGPGSSGDLPPDVQAIFDRYRVPVIA